MSYGLELRRADGTLALSSRETLFRLVHAEKCADNFTGTFSVPTFDTGGTFQDDTAKGFFYVQYEISPMPDSFNLHRPAIGSITLPSLNWDNATKVMTVAPANIPAGWPSSFGARPSYEIIFMHFG